MTLLLLMLGWIRFKLNRVIVSFSPINELYANDESGELMHRYIDYKSWFDRLTSWWVTKPALEKLLFLLVVTIVSCVIGLALAAFTVVVLATSSISLMLHSLFYAHEQHRHLGAKVFAAEQIASIADLEVSQQFFEGATSKLSGQVEQLGCQQQALKEQSARLESESQLIAIKNQTLITLVDGVETQTTRLVEQQRTADKALATIIVQAQDYEQHLVQSIASVSAVGNSAAQFSGAVHEIQQSQQCFAQAVTQFGLFVNERVSKNPSDAANKLVVTKHDAFLDAQERAIDDIDAFIAQWRQSSGR